MTDFLSVLAISVDRPLTNMDKLENELVCTDGSVHTGALPSDDSTVLYFCAALELVDPTAATILGVIWGERWQRCFMGHYWPGSG